MPNWNRSSLRARTTSATAAVAALVCIGFSVLFLMFAGSKETDDAQARATAGWARVLPISRHLPAVLPAGNDGPIQVLDTHNRVVAATPGLVGKPPMAIFPPTPSDTAVRTQRTLCPPAGLKGCKTIVSIKIYTHPEGVWLIDVAIPVIPWYGSSTDLFLAIGVSVLITTMMAVGVFRAVGKTLAPVDAIRTELAEITVTGLDRRVPVPGNQAEVKLLAETANATLDRLEGAYQQLRRFTSDASHDLRSPITAMRAQLEEARMYPQDTDWAKMTEAVLAGVERLQAIVTDLLTLARLDARAPFTRDPTDLGRLVGSELDRRTYRVEIVKDLRQNVFIEGDRLRITRLLVNLLDNAERHATSQITVSVRADGPTASLEVIDDGAGFAAEHREKVFERFTRLDASRSRDAGGTGLGLAIAREIAEAHQGTLTIQDSERGARFVLRLPRTPSLSRPLTHVADTRS
ncbi:MAG: Signal transduction histidine kinase [Actinomycetia bacterium]|nr:Signal transduction histidine kinase [Actinomycetes bacterium]